MDYNNYQFVKTHMFEQAANQQEIQNNNLTSHHQNDGYLVDKNHNMCC